MKIIFIICFSILACMLLLEKPVLAAEFPKSTDTVADEKSAMSKEEMIILLNTNFRYDKDEISKYLENGKSYKELKNICLYAYLSGKSLDEIVQLRELYTWSRIKVLLGLNPEKFYNRQIEYQADRLYNLMNLDRKITIKYMKLGFSAHQIKRASYIARKCNVPLYNILMMKTRQIKWGDVAEKLGLKRDDCMH